MPMRVRGAGTQPRDRFDVSLSMYKHMYKYVAARVAVRRCRNEEASVRVFAL